MGEKMKRKGRTPVWTVVAVNMDNDQSYLASHPGRDPMDAAQAAADYLQATLDVVAVFAGDIDDVTPEAEDPNGADVERYHYIVEPSTSMTMESPPSKDGSEMPKEINPDFSLTDAIQEVADGCSSCELLMAVAAILDGRAENAAVNNYDSK